MASKRDISDEDAALFRGALGDVRPLPDSERVDAVNKKPAARPRARPSGPPADDHLMPDGVLHDAPGLGDRQEFCRDGLHAREWRRLRRGQIKIDEELDLHGLRVDAARQALAQFLGESWHYNYHCIRIITGKGLGSHSAVPVLKAQVDRWLRLRPEVRAFCSATPRDGGTGAVYVLLRRSK